MDEKIVLNEEAIETLRSIAGNIWFFRTFIDGSDDKIYKIVDQMEKDFHCIMDLIKEKS